MRMPRRYWLDFYFRQVHSLICGNMMMRRGIVLWIASLVVLLVLNCQWIAGCGASLWQEWGNVGMWCWTALAATVIVLPYVLFRRMWVSVVLLCGYYAVMLANLLYLRTFGNWIPPGAYVLVGNLPAFYDSVLDSFRASDLGVPMLITAGVWLEKRYGGKRPEIAGRWICLWLVMMLGGTLLTFSYPRSVFDELKFLSDHHEEHALGVSRYSLPIVLINDISGFPRLSDANRRQVEHVLTRRIIDRDSSELRNLVVIFMESLESWPVGLKVDGVEVTPVINSLMAEETTFSTISVENCTGIGRSIDAQLLVLCGLLPPRDRVFSFAYPGNNYPSVFHAMKRKHESRVYSFTTDHPDMYNIGTVSSRFGVDTLYVVEDRAYGRRLNDAEFFDNVAAKIESDSLWRDGRSTAMQIVTYSCHAPFRPVGDTCFAVPDEWPSTLRRYISLVNYTDAALGRFIGYLRTKPGYEQTLVVIVGDHPAFGPVRREEFAQYLPACADGHIPLVMLNGRVGQARIDMPRRQCEIYSAMISLLGLGDYGWHGISVPGASTSDEGPFDEYEISSLILGYDLYRD